MRIVGIDIYPDRSSFALALLEGEKYELYKVSLRDLLRRLEELRPDIIAIDDISEFGDLLERIASHTGAKIVRAGRMGKKIRVVAKELGLWQGGHPSPQQTALLSAKLAALGIYDVIIQGVRETIIKISPERSSFRGGREAKYKRSLKIFIEHAKQDIEKRLREEGIEFDEYHRGSAYEIRAYENVFRIREALKDVDVQDVRLDIQASRPVKSSLKGKFIIGIDPGTHVGLAFLDVYGSLVHSTTLEGGRETVIGYIKAIGEPILIAVDVPEIPDFVKRVASALRAPIYSPDGPISIEEKREIASEYSLKGSSHERDALAAAVKAYYRYKAKIDRAIREARNFGIRPEDVVYLVIRNHSVVDAIAKLLPKPEEEDRKKKRVRRYLDPEREIEYLRSELYRLRRAYKEALEKIEEYEIELELLKRKTHKEILSDVIIEHQNEKIKALEDEVRELRERLEALENIIRELSREAPRTLDSVAIGKFLVDGTYRSISSLEPESIEEGDVVFIARPVFDEKGLKILSKARYVLTPRGSAKDLELKGPRVIPWELVTRRRLGGLVIYDRNSLERALKKLDEEEQKNVEKVFKDLIFELSKRVSA